MRAGPDWAAVESLLDRSIIFARVSGPQEVEVQTPTVNIGPAAISQASK